VVKSLCTMPRMHFRKLHNSYSLQVKNCPGRGVVGLKIDRCIKKEQSTELLEPEKAYPTGEFVIMAKFVAMCCII